MGTRPELTFCVIAVKKSFVYRKLPTLVCSCGPNRNFLFCLEHVLCVQPSLPLPGSFNHSPLLVAQPMVFYNNLWLTVVWLPTVEACMLLK